VLEKDGNFYLEANELLLAVIPISKNGFVVSPTDDYLKKGNTEAQKFFKDYSLIVFPGEISGFIVETGEKSEFLDLDNFSHAIRRQTKLDDSKLQSSFELNYLSLSGDKLKMIYNREGLRCRAAINGKIQDWDKFTKGAVYDSPYLKIKDGMMKVSDGNESYQVDFRGDIPVYQEFKMLKK
jgi:hypothetical protein